MKDPRTLLNKQVTQTTQPNTANKTGMKDPRTLPKSTTQMSSTPSQLLGVNAFNILNNATKVQSYNDVNKENNIISLGNINGKEVAGPIQPSQEVIKSIKQNEAYNNYAKKIEGYNFVNKYNNQEIDNKYSWGNWKGENGRLVNKIANTISFGAFSDYDKYKAEEENKKRFESSAQEMYDDLLKNKEQRIKEMGEDNYYSLINQIAPLTPIKENVFNALGSDVEYGNLQVQSSLAWNKYINSGKEEDKMKAESLDEQMKKYMLEHPDVGKTIVSDTAQYLPQLGYQLKNNAIPIVVSGATAYGVNKFTGNKQLAQKASQSVYAIGSTITGAKTSYDLARGGIYRDLINMGVTDEKAREISNDSAFWQTVVESAENIYSLKDIFSVSTSNPVKQRVKDYLNAYGVNILTESGEEGSQELIGMAYEKKALDESGLDSSEYTWQKALERAKKAFVGGGKIAFTMGIGETAVNVIINEMPNIQTNAEIQTYKNDIRKSINQSFDNAIAEAKKSNNTELVKKLQEQKLKSTTSDNINEAYETIKKFSENTQQPVQNVTSQFPNTQVQRQNNEVIPQQIEKQNNTNIVQNTLTNENISQNNIQQSLGTEQVRNAEVTREIQTFVDNRNKIFPGLSVEFDSALNTDGVIEKRADGTRIMKINPNSSRAYEFVAVHEMLHDLEGAKEQYQDLSSFVKERAMTHEDFETAKSNLTEQYTKYYQENGLDMSNLNMENETVNDMVARALGNQDFLNELAGNKPNVFMRMYNWVKNVLLDGQKTGKTFNERRAQNKYLQELKSKFEIAYNTAYKGKASQQYSIQVDSNGNKYVKVDTDQDIFEGKTLKEQKEIARKYILEKFREKGLMKDNQNINVTRKTANEYTNPKKFLDAKTISNKVKASTELDNMLNISKYKYSKPDDGRHVFAQNGWDYYETTFQVGNRTYTGLLNIAKSGNKKTLYDITNIKETNSKISVKTESVANSSLSNSIPSNSGAVNSQYMQDSPNNTQGLENSSSFSLGKNASNTLPEVSKGYTRLYRGLTQEYNTDYDKSKIDNSNGYESWTDNYELAKAYGDNVYYIDIPTSQIKDTIIDENSKSETYGDRNLVYKNNKPVGIKGKSGNEYMLYTDHDDFASIQYNKVPTSKQVEEYSQSNDKWQSYLDKNWDLMPNSKKTFGFPTNEQLQAMDNKKIAENVDTLNLKEKKIKSLEDIADMSEADLRNEKGVNYKHKKDKNTQYERKFFENVETSKIINQDIKDTIEITTYERQANEKTLAKANKKLDEQGDKLIKQWQNKTKNFTAEDVAIGAILIERYQQMGDTESAVNVVQKLADMGTEVGRTVQMYSIFQRLTPESMLIYQQRKLNDVFKEVSQRKTGEWVEANKEKFKLTADDSKFITEQVEKAQQATNERQKQIELAKIESRINDKLPPERGQTIKAIRRIAMLFNPKTQVRNVVGNALIMPVNDVADFIGTQIDKAIAKKTGIRTTNYANLKEKFKGFKKGITESIEDYKLGIRTEPTGSKYEFDFGGKSFNENTKSKTLNYINNKMNGINNLLGAVMSGGDRPFYEAAFNNSLQGQMKANNVATPTSEMIDIAVNEALSRTWNDSNNYTQAVLGIRREMNKLNIGGFGLGDLIIPFAKTPANLTKAMVEYSPLGTIEAIIDYSDMKKAISRGEMTAQQQKNFVNSTSKAIAGSILYLIAGAIAQTGAITGSADDDKDVRNFEQNVLGIQPYSIKIGDKTFTYSWANPLNAPLAIMADTYKMSKENASLFDILTNGFKTAGEVIVENSFLQGIKELFEADSISEGLTNAVVNMPSQFIPTFLSQFATFGDKNKRQTFEYGDKLKTTINQIKTKTPGLKNTLAPTVNTFGEEIQNYGGENNVFNVFLNPSNVSKANATDTQKELYALYEATKDKTIFPRQAPYYLSDDGEKINLSSYERAEYQKISGKYVSENLGALFDSEFYKTLENEQKVEVINEIVSDADTIAKDNWIDTNTTKKIAERNEKLKDVPLVDYYNAWIAQKDVEGKKKLKGETISGTKKKAKIKAINEAVDDDLTAEQKKILYGIFNLD